MASSAMSTWGTGKVGGGWGQYTGPTRDAVSPARPHAHRTVQRDELPALEDACVAFARAGHHFERLEATRQQLAELFKVRPPVCPLPGPGWGKGAQPGDTGTLLVGVMDQGDANGD